MNKNNQQETHIDTSWFATAKYIFLVLFMLLLSVCFGGGGVVTTIYHQVIVLAHLYLTNLKPEKSKSSLWKWQLYSGPYIIGINEEREHSMYKLVVLCPTLTSSSLFITAGSINQSGMLLNIFSIFSSPENSLYKIFLVSYDIPS